MKWIASILLASVATAWLDGCAAPELAREPTATVPFLGAFGLVFVELESSDGQPLLALLDTGASASAIDSRRSSGLPSLGSGEVVGTTGSLPVEMVELAGVRLGPVTFPDLRATSRDLSGLLAPEGRTVDMILGADALAGLTLTIDFGAQVLELATSMPTDAAVSTPMSLDNRIPTIPASIGGVELVLRIDTGASLFPTADVYVNVPTHVWNELRARDPGLAIVQHFQGTGADGRPVDLPVARVPDARIGPTRFAAVFVIVQPEAGYFADPSAKGFVGNNFLEKLGRVRLDFRRELLGSPTGSSPIGSSPNSPGVPDSHGQGERP